MLSGIALALSELPSELIARHALGRLIHDRGGEREVQFLFADAERLLPVWRNGQLQVLRWGNRRGESPRLPCTAWTQVGTVESGGGGDRRVETVVIPATVGLDNGVWYRIRQGIRGVVVLDERGCPRVYVLSEPSTHYYQVMVRREACSRNGETDVVKAASTPATFTGGKRAVGA
jgi:hypothetical protein